MVIYMFLNVKNTMKNKGLELLIPMLLIESEQNGAVSDREAINSTTKPNKTGSWILYWLDFFAEATFFVISTFGIILLAFLRKVPPFYFI